MLLVADTVEGQLVPRVHLKYRLLPRSRTAHHFVHFCEDGQIEYGEHVSVKRNHLYVHESLGNIPLFALLLIFSSEAERTNYG